MYTKFHALKAEKQERILKAAMREFARNGYERASSNEIIREADISKGSLFNYFNNKKELYLYLLDYAARIIDKVYEEVDWNETDLFERMRQFGLTKFKLYTEYPQVFFFLKSVAEEDASEVKTEISKLGEELVADGLTKGYQNIDWSKFRADMDIDKMINIMTWTFKSFAEQQISQVDSSDDLNKDVLAEWEAYYDILKRCFYKKEG